MGGEYVADGEPWALVSLHAHIRYVTLTGNLASPALHVCCACQLPRCPFFDLQEAGWSNSRPVPLHSHICELNY